MRLDETQISQLIKTLADTGISLSAEKDHTRLLESILMKAQEITNADGGTIYSMTEQNELLFEIMINKSMNIHLGGTSKNKSSFKNLPLYDANGNPDKTRLAPWAAISKQAIVIDNAYNDTQFDLSGTKDFDKMTGYHSQAFLTVPMTNHLNEVIGVLQLINPKDKQTNQISTFSKLDEYLVCSLASQAAIIITNSQLIQAQKQLFDALIQLIAKAIDDKSAYTGGHCRRVPIITRMLAQAAIDIDKGPLKDFSMTEDELYELEVAAWLHDCGKITTPEAVVDKATKLEQIIDGIHLIDTRFEVIKRDAIIERLQNTIKEHTGKRINLHEDSTLQKQLEEFRQDQEFLKACNQGGEHIQEEQLQHIKRIAQRTWVGLSGTPEKFLNENEVNLLSIARGTLSDKERTIINNHVTMTIKMLESLPYPKKLKRVPELAGGHHEKMDGTGYPKNLQRAQIPIPARMIAIADVFEALTAQDRPYKKAMPLSQALNIMGKMKQDGHIDPDLFDVFMHAKIYQKYAKEHLNQDALDWVDLKKIPGYQTIK